MALKRMDNVGIVVDDLEGTINFFRELGLELEGRATMEGEWAGRVTAMKYGIRSIPTLMLFKGGVVEAQHVGLLSKEQLSKLLESRL